MNKYKIGDVVKVQLDYYEITKLPGHNETYPEFYEGIDYSDNQYELFSEEEIDYLSNNKIKNNSPYTFYDSEMTSTFDCDDTIVMWNIGQNCPYDMWSYEEQQKCKPEDVVRIEDPYKIGDVYYLVKHNRHIKLLQDYKARGFGIIVWSAGGALWAKAVVDALGIGPDVDLVMAKPNRHVDDMPCTTWMGERIYIDRNKH